MKRECHNKQKRITATLFRGTPNRDTTDVRDTLETFFAAKIKKLQHYQKGQTSKKARGNSNPHQKDIQTQITITKQ